MTTTPRKSTREGICFGIDAQGRVTAAANFGRDMMSKEEAQSFVRRGNKLARTFYGNDPEISPWLHRFRSDAMAMSTPRVHKEEPTP